MAQLTKKKSWARKQHSYEYIYKIYLDVDLSHKFDTLKRISQKLLEMAILLSSSDCNDAKGQWPSFLIILLIVDFFH